MTFFNNSSNQSLLTEDIFITFSQLEIVIFAFKSDFVYIFKIGFFAFEISSFMYFSSSQPPLVGSIKYMIKSESKIEFIATSFIFLLNSFSDLWIPGVSKNIICESESL